MSRSVTSSRLERRKMLDLAMRTLCVAASLVVLGALASVLGYALWHGIGRISWSFFTRLPAPAGETGGGFAHALVGTAVMVGLASVLSIPVGVAAGVYLADLGRGWKVRVVRLVNELLAATPSIVAGLFAYASIVLVTRRFSAFAGGVALAVLMVPPITRTTEEAIRLVPSSLREASLAVGAREAQTILAVVLPAALPGITTGTLLAIARASGETAALLFTAFNSRFLSISLDQPMSSVGVQVYTYAVSPYPDQHHQAWAGALVLVLVVATFSAIVRLTAGRRRQTA